MPVLITRCSNNYGPNQYPEKLIPFFIKRILNNQKVPVYGDGMNVRDWLYVDDHCRAIEQVLLHGRIGEVYNIGGHNEKTNLEITRIILKELGKDEYEFAYEIIDLIDDGWNINRNWVSISDFSFDKSSSITLRRKLKNEGDDLREKYKKVVEDYFFKIEANWDYYKEYEAHNRLCEALEKDIDII